MNEIRVLEKTGYPENLRNITHPPKKLYYRGDLPDDWMTRKFLCVIGSRMWSPYGRNVVDRIFREMTGFPVSIVSGLAFGIDSLAHEAALKAGLHCIAFPGSTLAWDAIYPQARLGLAHRIVESGGMLMSQWPVGYETGNWAFPARNVLMAGISHATLVIEAGRHSGSLKTAEHALGFGRDVFAVPGSIFHAHSYGTHMLLKDGARLIESSADILIGLGLDPVASAETKRRTALDGLDEEARRIFDLVALGGMTVDSLIERSGLAIDAVNDRLSALEIAGLIEDELGSFRAL